MESAVSSQCPGCRRECAASELVCGLCGELLRRAAPVAHAVFRTNTSLVADNPGRATKSPDLESPAVESAWQKNAAWLYLGVGALTAPVFALTPMLGYMGWFLASLVHEMGHAGFAWFCGMPAFPAISLDGHAAAMHGEQERGLVALIALALCTTAWRLLRGPARFVTPLVFAVGYPLIALTGARDVLFLLAGHAGELAFALLALWKTLDGGFTRSKVERALYSTVGWFLLGKNLALCWGLMRSESARADYMTSGSFGMTNDYLRIAEDLLYWQLESVALLMLIASLAVLPLALLAWRVSSRLRQASSAHSF